MDNKRKGIVDIFNYLTIPSKTNVYDEPEIPGKNKADKIIEDLLSTRLYDF